jgi:hypothetical protein
VREKGGEERGDEKFRERRPRKKNVFQPPQNSKTSKTQKLLHQLGRPRRLRALRHRALRRGRLGAPRQGRSRGSLLFFFFLPRFLLRFGARKAQAEPEGVVRRPRPRRDQAAGQPQLVLLQARRARAAAGPRRVDGGRARPLPAGREAARRRRPLGPLLELDPAEGGLPSQRVLPGRGHPRGAGGGREVQDDEDGEGAVCRRVGSEEEGRRGGKERERRGGGTSVFPLFKPRRWGGEGTSVLIFLLHALSLSTSLPLSLSTDAQSSSFYVKGSCLKRAGWGLRERGRDILFLKRGKGKNKGDYLTRPPT